MTHDVHRAWSKVAGLLGDCVSLPVLARCCEYWTNIEKGMVDNIFGGHNPVRGTGR